MDAFPPGARGAGLAAGLTAAWGFYRAGQDVREALIAAGYAAETANSLANRVYTSWDSQETTTTRTDPRQSVKRSRRSSGSLTKVPVAKSVKKYVKACMDKVIERKSFRQTINLAGSAGLWAQFDLGTVNIVQGDTSAQRTGAIIHLDYVELRGEFTTSAGDGRTGRLMVIKDKQANGAYPAVTDLLNASTWNASFNQFTAPPIGNRFSVLKDWQFTVHPDTTTEEGRKSFYFKVKLGFPVRYDGNTGTITDIVGNNVTLWWNPGAVDLAANPVECILFFKDN